MSLYDIQPFTEITVNSSVDLAIPAYVEGNSSGATGFLRSPVGLEHLDSMIKKANLSKMSLSLEVEFQRKYLR